MLNKIFCCFYPHTHSHPANKNKLAGINAIYPASSEHSTSCRSYKGYSGHIYQSPLGNPCKLRVINSIFFRLGDKPGGDGFSVTSDKKYQQDIKKTLTEFYQHRAEGYEGKFQLMVDNDARHLANQTLETMSGWTRAMKDEVSILTPKLVRERFTDFIQDRAISSDLYSTVSDALTNLETTRNPWMKSDIGRLLLLLSSIEASRNSADDNSLPVFTPAPSLYLDQGLLAVSRTDVESDVLPKRSFEIKQGACHYDGENSVLSLTPQAQLLSQGHKGIDGDANVQSYVESLKSINKKYKENKASWDSWNNPYGKSNQYLLYMPILRQNISALSRKEDKTEDDLFLLNHWKAFKKLVMGQHGSALFRGIDEVLFSTTVTPLAEQSTEGLVGSVLGKQPQLENAGGWCLLDRGSKITQRQADIWGYGNVYKQALREKNKTQLSHIAMHVQLMDAYVFSRQQSQTDDMKKVNNAYHRYLNTLLYKHS